MKFIVNVLFLMLVIIELPYLVKKKMWREAVVFSVLLLTGWVYALGFLFKWQLPTIMQLMEIVFMPVTSLIEQIIS